SGYTDFGCYGSAVDTPNIDAFAAEGIRFTDCHSAAPNCSPSRAGMLTGRIPPRVGMYSYIPPNHPMHLRDEEITIAEILKAENYATGHFGKWHLSSLEFRNLPGPNDQGFDYSLGTSNNAQPTHENPVNFVRNGEAIGKVEGYSCQIVVDEAIGWLDTVPKDQRLFACVWFHEPHSKIASPAALVEKYQERGMSKKDALYHANIENVDIAFGRLMKKLEELGRKDNTLVFLTSDNGGVNAFSNQGLRGKKSFVYEGGQREPGILRWPAAVEARQTRDETVSHLDLLPTICDATGVKRPDGVKLDGVSWMPMLSGEKLERPQPLFWFFYRVEPAAALRLGDFVLLGHLERPEKKYTHGLSPVDMPWIKKAKLVSFEIYNLNTDLKQEKELSKSHPEKLEEMRKLMLEIHADVLADGHDWEW
ncbi:MAG: sulfatase-like hydrolase/transferase, partial [Verrucomicrobiota bacterium]